MNTTDASVGLRSERPRQSSSLLRLPRPSGGLLLVSVCGLAVLAGLCLGPMGIAWGDIVAIVGHRLRALTTASPMRMPEALRVADHVLWNLRAPRVAMGLVVGAGLASAGALLQGTFRNPLADPGILGTSSGAALGAALWIVVLGAVVETWTTGGTFDGAASVSPTASWGPQLAGALPRVFAAGLVGAAFVFGLLATGVVVAIARRSSADPLLALLLCGIAIQAACGAIIGLLGFVSDDVKLRDLTVWMLGGLGAPGWGAVALAGVVLGITLLLARGVARGLDLCWFGDGEAQMAGLDVTRHRRLTLLAAVLGVTAAVSFCGPIGFVGLIAPHLVRLSGVVTHVTLLPYSAWLGAALVVGSDAIARIVVAPAELPLGIVLAVIGVPMLTWLLLRRLEGLEVTA